jgi:hypothetical protein
MLFKKLNRVKEEQKPLSPCGRDESEGYFSTEKIHPHLNPLRSAELTAKPIKGEETPPHFFHHYLFLLFKQHEKGEA